LKENFALAVEIDTQLRRELGLVGVAPTDTEPAK
jgi:hypothetical protein